MEMLKQAADLDVIHAPYRGAGVAMTDLVAGHVPLMVGGIAPAIGFIQERQSQSAGGIPIRVTIPMCCPKYRNFQRFRPT